MYIGLHVNCPLFLSVSINLNFLSGFSSNPQISTFVKILPVGAELFHTDERTEGRTYRQTHTHSQITKPIVAFQNFANAAKIKRMLLLGISNLS